MAICFTEAEEDAVSTTYNAYPEPKPDRNEFYTYVFHTGVEQVKVQDPAFVRVEAPRLVDRLWKQKFLGRRGRRPAGAQP